MIKYILCAALLVSLIRADMEQDAKNACTSMGWTVHEVSANGGAIVCTAPGTGAGANCNTCDTWRLMVFVDGGQDQSPSGQAYGTVAGSYYSGHTPCAGGWNLDYCGEWGPAEDCMGVVDGDAVEDECGVCQGDNSSCAGCDGVPNSGLTVDDCGECGGNGSTCGPQGNAYAACEAMGWTVHEVSANDGAIVCTAPGTGAGANCNSCDTWRLYVFVDGGQDQSPSGQAYSTVAGSYYSGHTPCAGGDNLDYCGDFAPLSDCAGVVGGDSVVDDCGVCGGDNSSCADCAGTPNGNASEDECGVCEGDNSSCTDCAGTPNGDAEEDDCGVCNGDGSTCADCAGTPNGDAEEDACGVCDGDNSSCADCAGTPYGDAEEDECGVCNGDGSSCATTTTAEPVCQDFNEKKLCKKETKKVGLDCTWQKAISTCTPAEGWVPSCPDYNGDKKSCKKVGCEWKKKTEECLDPEPCTDQWLEVALLTKMNEKTKTKNVDSVQECIEVAEDLGHLGVQYEPNSNKGICLTYGVMKKWDDGSSVGTDLEQFVWTCA